MRQRVKSPTVESERAFKLLTLTAKAVHHNGEHSEVQETFGAAGGSIGRQTECDMVLPDPDRRISRLQARVLVVDGQYAVCNASTSNPMYVNGVELSPGSSQAIGDGDELRAGSYVMTVSQAANAPPPASLPNGRQETVLPAPANAVSRGASTSQESAHSTVDPLLALGTNPLASANPFADLLGQPTPINGTQETGPNAKDIAPPPSSTSAANGLPDAHASERSPLPRQDRSTPTQPSMESRLAEQPPGDSTVVRVNPESHVNGPSQLPAAGYFDPNDPFGDLLASKIPAGAANAGSGAVSGAESPLSRQDMAASSAIWQPNHADQQPQTANDEPPPNASNTLENLLEKPVRPAVPRRPSFLEEIDESTLPALAGDPFADLMGAPVEEHMAHAPPFDSPPRRAAVIPDDFNPLAFGGVAQRNSSDPLTPMGQNARGLADVVPTKTIDSVYSPGNESPTVLTIDPLELAPKRLLKVEQSTDPLKLFANGGKGLILDDPGAPTSGSTRDDAREMVTHFRAPVPVIDPGMRAKATGNISDAAPPPELDLPGEPASAHLPADFLASVTSPNMALPPEADQDSDPSSPMPAVLDVSSGANNESETGPGQNSPQVESKQPNPDPDPHPLAAPPSIQARPSADQPPDSARKSDDPKTEELMAAFKRGAGLDEWSATSLTPEVMETLGHLLQTAVQGAVSLLAARAAIKQEIHLSVTLINPKANNPLKFLPDGHTAMLQMLGPKMPGFMAPADAMQEAFNDLLTHQTAIAAGTQATIEALFRRFAPEAIEARYPKLGVGEKLSQTVHYARLWNIYASEYKLIREEIRDDFFKRLGSEFHDAYNREYGNDTNDE
jgi:type VI secretion system FHA domain protein